MTAAAAQRQTEGPLVPSQALRIVREVVERWPATKLTPEQMRKYAEDLDGLDAGATWAALDVLHRQGRQWAPTAGEVRRETARLELGAPDWAEVKRQLVERARALDGWEPPPWSCPYEVCDGNGYEVLTPADAVSGRKARRCRCWGERREARRLAETLHPLVREFIDKGYATWHEVDKLGQGRADRDTLTLEAQLREKWAAFSARAVESRAFADIDAAPDLARLEQAREEDAPRPRRRHRAELGHVDALAALPSPDVEAA